MKKPRLPITIKNALIMVIKQNGSCRDVCDEMVGHMKKLNGKPYCYYCPLGHINYEMCNSTTIDNRDNKYFRKAVDTFVMRYGKADLIEYLLD